MLIFGNLLIVGCMMIVLFIYVNSYTENMKTVGNTAIFADAQYTMSPYDTDQVFTETSKKYYSQFHELFKNDHSCIANDDALLAYHGKGMYAVYVVDVLVYVTYNLSIRRERE